MNKNTLSPQQRKRLEELVKEARDKQERKFHKEKEKLSEEICREMARKAGCLEVLERVVKVKLESDADEKLLKERGFQVDDDGGIRLAYSCPVEMDHALNQRLEERMRSLVDFKGYDAAILAVWTAATAEEAKKAVEGLLK
jgi:predicted CopG family antitoxin